MGYYPSNVLLLVVKINSLIELEVRYNKWIAVERKLLDKLNIVYSLLLSELGLCDRGIRVSLILTHDEEITELNKEYRDKPKATNVLSFQFFNNLDTIIEYNERYKEVPLVVGDVFMSYQTLHKEALEQSKNFIEHSTHIFLHGVLHLFGYNHVEEQEANLMETLEAKILNEISISNPYVQ